jgi:hypothetical protein
MGGLGIEYTRDVAVAPDGTIVAFNVIGVRGESLEQIGFVHFDEGGREFQSEFENQLGASLRLPPTGAFTIASSGNMVLAVTGLCGGGCPTVGGASIDGGAVVVLTPTAELVWSRGLPGEVVSNVDVDGGGDVLVASRAPGGGALRKYDAGGELAWERTGVELGPGAPVAFDAAGNALYGRGDAVVKLGADGERQWSMSLGGGAGITAIRPAGDGVVVHGRFTGRLQLAGASVTPPQGARHGYFLASLAPDGSARWVRAIDAVQEISEDGVKTLLDVDPAGRISVVTGADACTAAVHQFEPSGARRWRRSLAVNGCGGRELVVHGLAATPSGRVAVGGALNAPVDLGGGTLEALATDAFLVALLP